MDQYSSPYICFCSKIGHTRGVCINWNNNEVDGYDCQFPNCLQDCQLQEELPIGFKPSYPKKPD